ncbi:MAG: DsbA family protein [Nanoarchaeota archaeon]
MILKKYDKHSLKVISLGLFLINLILLSIFFGLLIENKIINKNTFNFSSEYIDSFYFNNNNSNSLQNNNNSNNLLDVILYIDFECPFVMKFNKKNYEKLTKEYVKTNKINLIYKHFPYTIHKKSLLKSQAFECAKEQNLEMEIYDFLYKIEEIEELKNIFEDKKNYSNNISFTNFKDCIETQKYKNFILYEKQNAIKQGISKTPTILINNEIILEGIKPYFIIEKNINSQLKQ